MAQRVERLTCDQQVVGSIPIQKLHNNLGQVVHTYMPLSPTVELGTGLGVVMLCGWEGNRRLGVK